ncbi:MAG: hypothetical protein HY985_04545 [Magnetospirillum sp.]|nr:hypothetical protein [Magnetospirillum sp.]
MLRIEEIVGAMDDEFRYVLAAMDDSTLRLLLEDVSALRRLRPVGVSNREARAMITAILDTRAHSRELAELAKHRRPRVKPSVKAKAVVPPPEAPPPPTPLPPLPPVLLPPPRFSRPKPPLATPAVIVMPAPPAPPPPIEPPPPPIEPDVAPVAPQVSAPVPVPTEKSRWAGLYLAALAAAAVAALILAAS